MVKKSKKTSAKRAGPTKGKSRTPPTLAQLLMLVGLGEVNDSIDPEVKSRFDSVTKQYGAALHHSFGLMARSHVTTWWMERFTPVESDSEDVQWERGEVFWASRSFGLDSIKAARDELTVLSASAEEPGAVTFLCIPTPTMDSGKFLLMVLAGDAQGNMLVGFGGTKSWQWGASGSEPVVEVVERLMRYEQGLPADFFDAAAVSLDGELEQHEAAGSLGRRIPFLRTWLASHMRAIGDVGTTHLYDVVESFSETLAGLEKSTQELVTKFQDDTDKAVARQRKQAEARVEKAELLAQGSAARAKRLDAELQALRKTASSKNKPTEKRHDESLAQALDRLFVGV